MQMRLLYHFWRQIIQRPTVSLPLIMLTIEIRPSEVSQFQVIFFTDQNILRLDIPMYDVQFMDILDRHYYLRDVFSCCGFLEPFCLWFHHSFVEFSLLCVFQHEVNGKLVLKMVVEFDDVGMIEAVHDLYLCANMVNHLLTCYRLLADLFDGIDGACFFVFCLPDSPIRTLT